MTVNVLRNGLELQGHFYCVDFLVHKEVVITRAFFEFCAGY